MIAGIFHQGSGLGNQLHRYVATRVKALDLDVDFGMMYVPDGSGKVEGFKGKDFMNLDTGKEVRRGIFHYNSTGNIFAPPDLPTFLPEHPMSNFVEKKVQDEFGNDIRGYDPEFNFIEDNTLIDGEFQEISIRCANGDVSRTCHRYRTAGNNGG